MKKSILLPLFLGLLLAGCSRANSDAQKLSSSDQSDPDKPTYNDQAITAKKRTTDQSQVAATPVPAPTPGTDSPAAPLKSTSDPSQNAANPALSEPAIVTASIPHSPPTDTTPAPAAPLSADMAGNNNNDAAKPDLSARLAEWKLNPDDIKGELESTGQIVRSKIPGAGEPTGVTIDSVLIGQVSFNLQENIDTSTLKIDVSADKSVVTLNGSAHSLDQIGKAIALSLDTPGVTQTISKIKLDMPAP